MRKRLVALTSVAITLAGSAIATSPAEAASCTASDYHTQPSTTATTSTCQNVQAQIDRYVSNYLTAYYGPIFASRSSVTATNGINAGNAICYELLNVWSAWQYA